MRRTGATVGLVVLALVAAALAFAAMRNTRSMPAPEPLASALTTPSEERPDKDTEPKADVIDALPETIEPPLLMVDADLAYRGRTGTCLGGAALERTTNGGRSWRPVDAPAAAILDLRSAADGSVEVVGADERCRTRVWTSVDQGETWSGPVRASGLFARLPDTARDIMTPTGTVRNPCPDREVAPVAVEEVSASEAAVLCLDGEMVRTGDGGATWTAMTAVAGAQALAFEGPRLGWVLVRDGGRCAGYEARITQDGGAIWQLGGCLFDELPADERLLPSVSFATTEKGMADLDGQTFVTGDGGPTWQQAR
jgi:photosystem II stability/assembly factor-like uncharacterized protein